MGGLDERFLQSVPVPIIGHSAAAEPNPRDYDPPTTVQQLRLNAAMMLSGMVNSGHHACKNAGQFVRDADAIHRWLTGGAEGDAEGGAEVAGLLDTAS